MNLNLKIAIFVDGSNMSAALKEIGLRPDYSKILEHYGKEGEVVNATYFTALPPKHIESPLRKLTDYLQYNKWNLVSKETKTFMTRDGMTVTKGNMDIEIVTEAWEITSQSRIDKLVLFSGDGDFIAMVRKLQRMAIKVEAVSLLGRDNTNMMDDGYRKTVDKYTDLRDLRHFIEKNTPIATPVVPGVTPTLAFLRRKSR